MALNKIICGVTFLFFTATIIGCEPNTATEEQDLTAEQLPGYWEVTQAIRDKKPTTTLEDAYFEFGAEKVAKLNVDGRDQTGTYELKDKIVEISGTSMDGKYKILQLQNDSMRLSVSKDIRGFVYNFVFNMIKTTPPVEKNE